MISIAYITRYESVARAFINIGQIGKVSHIGQFIKIYYAAIREGFKTKMDEAGADETATAGNWIIIQNTISPADSTHNPKTTLCRIPKTTGQMDNLASRVSFSLRIRTGTFILRGKFGYYSLQELYQLS